MTNIEKIIAEGNLGLFMTMRKGNNVVFCRRFGIPMHVDTSYNLGEWMLSECKSDIKPSVNNDTEKAIRLCMNILKAEKAHVKRIKRLLNTLTGKGGRT